jgi:molybdenum cofactor guanylyltransferase
MARPGAVSRPNDGAPFSGAILTGGRSSRFGSNKALAIVDGRAMAGRVADALADAGAAEVLAIGGDAVALAALGITPIADRRPGEGPLDGLITAIGAATNDLVVVLACDLPFVTSELIGALVSAMCVGSVVVGQTRADVALAEADGRVEPLVGCWRASRCLPVLEQTFASGERAVHRALAGLSVTTAAASPETVVNVNRTDDLER